MKSLFETIKERQENKSKANSERATLLEEFVIEINKERIASNYKPLITGKAVAMKVGHLKNIQDFFRQLILEDNQYQILLEHQTQN